MKHLLQISKRHLTALSLIFLLIINLIAYHIWFFGTPILTSGDWWFAYSESTRELLTIPQLWTANTNIGSISLALTFAPKLLLNGLLSAYNISPQLNNEITYLWPTVILSSIGYYLLGKKIVGSHIAGIFSSITFSFSVINIGIRSGHLTLATAHAFAPFALLWLIKGFQSKKYQDFIIAGFWGYLVSFNEVRAFYVLAMAMGICYLYYTFIIDKFKTRWVIKNTLLFGMTMGIALLLNAYWLLPFALVTPEPNSGFELLGRTLFGGPNYNILYSFTSWNIWWTGKLQASAVQPIPIYFWIIPFIAFLGLLLRKKNQNVILFGLIALLGMFLGKQGGAPFTNVYQWLYSHVPGFNAFREASKFNLLILTGYSIMIGAFLDWLWKKTVVAHQKKYLGFALIFLLGFIYLWNAKPLITGEIGSIFIPRHIPPQYLSVKSYLQSQPGYFKILWIPTISRWGIFTNDHPSLNTIELVQSDWDYLIYNYVHNTTRGTDQGKLLYFINRSDFSNILNDSSIKYIIVPLVDTANDDNFYVYYGRRDKYIDQLDRKGYLKKININTPGISIYENTTFRPHFYITADTPSLDSSQPYSPVTFYRVNSTQYAVELTNVSGKESLNFSERFHPDWKVRVGNFSWWRAILSRSYFLPDRFHFSDGTRMNSFTIDPQYLIKNYPASVSTNPDGSINVKLTLYFKPEAYVYVGMIVAMATFLGGVCFIIFQKRNKHGHG